MPKRNYFSVFFFIYLDKSIYFAYFFILYIIILQQQYCNVQYNKINAQYEKSM